LVVSRLTRLDKHADHHPRPPSKSCGAGTCPPAQPAVAVGPTAPPHRNRLRPRYHGAFESTVRCPCGSPALVRCTSPIRAITSIRSDRAMSISNRSARFISVRLLSARFDIRSDNRINRPEVLPGIGKHQQEQARQRRPKLPHLAIFAQDLPPSQAASCRSPWQSRFLAYREKCIPPLYWIAFRIAAAAAIYAAPAKTSSICVGEAATRKSRRSSISSARLSVEPCSARSTAAIKS